MIYCPCPTLSRFSPNVEVLDEETFLLFESKPQKEDFYVHVHNIAQLYTLHCIVYVCRAARFIISSVKQKQMGTIAVPPNRVQRLRVCD